MILRIFSCACGHLYIIFREISVQALCPSLNFFFVVVFVLEVLYILWIFISNKIFDLQIFYYILWVAFSLWYFLLMHQVSKFSWSLTCLVFLLLPVLLPLVSYPRVTAKSCRDAFAICVILRVFTFQVLHLGLWSIWS